MEHQQEASTYELAELLANPETDSPLCGTPDEFAAKVRRVALAYIRLITQIAIAMEMGLVLVEAADAKEPQAMLDEEKDGMKRIPYQAGV